MARQGFFKTSTLMTAPLQVIDAAPKCGACGLYKTCISPKMPPVGEGKKKILIVAESPGKEEDEKGIQLVGNSSRKLEEMLDKLGCNLRRDCTLTNALICHPPDSKIDDSAKIEYCRPNLLETLKATGPTVVIALGGVPVESLVGHLWRDDVGGIKRWAGFNIPSQSLNAWICPTFHPAYLLREKTAILEQYTFEHLRRALAHTTRPFETVPDYKSQVEIIKDVEKAAHILDKMVEKGGTISFDYETNMLKPDSPQAQIFSCAVCWEGKKTIAYPWMGVAIKATRRLLKSKLKKIGANMKFEQRWTQAKLDLTVKDWVWDVVLGMHWGDYRPKITSVKFQSFVLLGQPPYNNNISALLESDDKGGNTQNRIRDIDLGDLLLYNGMDALLEFKIAEIHSQWGAWNSARKVA